MIVNNEMWVRTHKSNKTKKKLFYFSISAYKNNIVITNNTEVKKFFLLKYNVDTRGCHCFLLCI